VAFTQMRFNQWGVTKGGEHIETQPSSGVESRRKGKRKRKEEEEGGRFLESAAKDFRARPKER